MSGYDFKAITVVPDGKVLVDIVLSMTQRQTPTVVHKHYKISRIRQFYMRKVRYTQQNFHDKLSLMIKEFPKMEDVHPFYADLMNVLYDKDHYKLALGQVNTARNLIDNCGRDYVRLLKFGDSLYRCKMLKRAAMGRMATVAKGLNSNLKYLETVRQHLSRLPSINPSSRTILICGLPNVGKSSFLNKVTRANVEVQPYAFTTKALYVGHTDFKYLRYQVIDTPGILDHCTEECNIIEMQAVTALAHLRACILYVMDLSEFCGYSIEQQVSLFQRIKPVFANKPFLVVYNKSDIVTLDNLSPEKREALAVIEDDASVVKMTMSNVNEAGVADVKAQACTALLEYRIASKKLNNRDNELSNCIRITTPKVTNLQLRPTHIPESVLRRQSGMDVDEAKTLERDIELQEGDDYALDLQKYYDLPEQDRHHVMPEILAGHNIADFYDPDIEQKLKEMEEEEELREKAGYYDIEFSEDDDDTKEKRSLARQIRHKKMLLKTESHIQKSSTKPIVPRTKEGTLKRGRSVSRLRQQMEELGVDMSDTQDAHFTHKRSSSRPAAKRQRIKSSSRARSSSRPPRDESGLPSIQARKKVTKIAVKAHIHKFVRKGNKGESDRHVFVKRPKHLYCGKRGIGKTDRR